MKNLMSIFVAYGVVWILHVGYLVGLGIRQRRLKQEISSLKALIEQAGQTAARR